MALLAFGLNLGFINLCFPNASALRSFSSETTDSCPSVTAFCQSQSRLALMDTLVD